MITIYTLALQSPIDGVLPLFGQVFISVLHQIIARFEESRYVLENTLQPQNDFTDKGDG